MCLCVIAVLSPSAWLQEVHQACSLLSDRTKIYAHDDFDAQYRRPAHGLFPRRAQWLPTSSYRQSKVPLDPFIEEATPSEVPQRQPPATGSSQPRRLHFSNAIFINDQASSVPRGGGVRRLPPTPAQPSLLNIDNLTQDPSLKARDLLGSDLFNFPRLETSPTKILLKNIGRFRGRPGEESHQTRPGRPTWSRSLDDPLTFEEAVIAGRGTRQLPVIGPQQLLQGRGRGPNIPHVRRELPRPGTSVDLTMTNGSQRMNMYPQAIYDSDEDEDWC